MTRHALMTLAMLAMLTPALAHSPLEISVPADGDEMISAPEMIDIPSRDKIGTISLTPDFMGAGSYQVDWRALSKDGHVITGSFSFTVTGE